MATIVSLLVGALVAASALGFMDEGRAHGEGAGDIARARERARRSFRRARRSVERARALVERGLAEHGVVTSRRRAERERIERAMPEAFGALAISLGSGFSLAQAMQYVGGRSEEPVRTEFLHASALMTCGVSSVDALDELVARLNAPALDLVVLALKVSRKTGASLTGLLSEAAGLVGERIELARNLEVKTAQVRMSARLVAGMPVIMVGFLSLVSRDFRAGVATGPGIGSLAVALALNIAAWLVIRKIMQVDV